MVSEREVGILTRGETPNTVILARNQVGQATRSKISTEVTETH